MSVKKEIKVEPEPSSGLGLQQSVSKTGALKRKIDVDEKVEIGGKRVRFEEKPSVREFFPEQKPTRTVKRRLGSADAIGGGTGPQRRLVPALTVIKTRLVEALKARDNSVLTVVVAEFAARWLHSLTAKQAGHIADFMVQNVLKSIEHFPTSTRVLLVDLLRSVVLKADLTDDFCLRLTQEILEGGESTVSEETDSQGPESMELDATTADHVDTVRKRGLHRLKTLAGSTSILSLLTHILAKGLLNAASVPQIMYVAQLTLAGTVNVSQRVFAAKFLIGILQGDAPLEDRLEVYRFLRGYCEDRSGKVQRIVIEGIESFFENWKSVDVAAFSYFAELTTGQNKFVRLSALRIMVLYAEHKPEEKVKRRRKNPLRLVDDAFSVVCHAMNDLEVDVRSQAARLLGLFEGVSESFLMQTLDKKLMRNMRMLADGRMASSGAGDWSTGKILHEGVPVGGQQQPVDEEEVETLMPSGACGAFVTALEDEFKAVRQPAVYSLGKLAANRPDFAKQSVEHLADMFNDEILQVRIDAVLALTPLVMYGELDDDQLKTLFTGLDDANDDNRIALLELLSRSYLANTQCILDLLSNLISTSKRFPSDRPYILKCSSSIGARHAELMADIVDDVFRLHPVLKREEPTVVDVHYTIKLIMLLNAAAKSSLTRSLLPDFVQNHYRFLRLSMPDNILVIESFETGPARSVTSGQRYSDVDADTHVSLHVERLLALQNEPSAAVRRRGYEAVIASRQLLHEAQFSGIGICLHKFAEILLLLGDIREAIVKKSDIFADDLRAVLHGVLFLETHAVGLDASAKLFLFACRVTVDLLYLAIAVKKGAWRNNHLFCTFAKRLCFQNARQIDRYMSRFPCPGLSICEYLKSLHDSFSLPKFLLKGLFPDVDLFSMLRPLVDPQAFAALQLVQSTLPLPHGQIRVKSVTVIEPAVGKVQPVQQFYMAGVAVSLVLHNLTKDQLSRFRIRVDYSNGTTSYITPSRSGFVPSQSSMSRLSVRDQWRLTTEVPVVGLKLPDPSVTFTFGLLVDEAPQLTTIDRGEIIVSNDQTSLTPNGVFLALPNATSLLESARCQVQLDTKWM